MLCCIGGTCVTPDSDLEIYSFDYTPKTGLEPGDHVFATVKIRNNGAGFTCSGADCPIVEVALWANKLGWFTPGIKLGTGYGISQCCASDAFTRDYQITSMTSGEIYTLPTFDVIIPSVGTTITCGADSGTNVYDNQIIPVAELAYPHGIIPDCQPADRIDMETLNTIIMNFCDNDIYCEGANQETNANCPDVCPPDCSEGQITSTCVCGGTEYSSGYCCSGVYSTTACSTPTTKTCSDLGGTWGTTVCPTTNSTDITSSVTDNSDKGSNTYCCKPKAQTCEFFQKEKDGECVLASWVYIVLGFVGLMIFMKVLGKK